jgi:hypothetical protein
VRALRFAENRCQLRKFKCGADGQFALIKNEPFLTV